MKIVLISDTHNKYPIVPDGDMIIHAGDMTLDGTYMEISKFGVWFRELPHKHKVCIAGNHDILFQKAPLDAVEALGTGITYLQDTEETIGGLRIYGSPWQPEFCDWAFNLPRGKPLADRWKNIPHSLDVLITHGPPFGILDTSTYGRKHYQNLGCEELIKEVAIKQPSLHVFGHIHDSHGIQRSHMTTFVNAAQGYKLEHKPVVLRYDVGKHRVRVGYTGG